MLSDRCLSVLSVSVCDVGVLWPNSWMDQDEAWRGGGPRPSHIMLGGDPAPPEGHRPPIFGPCLLWPSCWMDQGATWYEGMPRPREHCVICGPISPPPLIRGTELHFLSDVYCDQMAGWIQMPLGTKVGLGPGHIVSDGDPVPQRGHSPQFSAHVYCGQTVAYLSC